jgi:hypothetical protein
MSINTIQHERHAGSGQDLVEVVGSFNVASTSGTVSAVKGRGFTVARTSTGLFSVTLDRLYPEMVADFVNHSGAFADNDAAGGTYTASTGVYTILTTDEDAAGVQTNVDPTVAMRISFHLYMTKYSTQVTP